MGQTTLGDDTHDLSELRARYDELVHETLPETAQAGESWPVDRDHCFGRIVLDNVFGDEWYDHVDGRPAYEHLSPDELADAVEIAERMAEEGPSTARELNRNSLRWRGELDAGD